MSRIFAGQSGVTIYTEDSLEVALYVHNDPNIATDNTRRMVACWNAFEGIQTDAVEAIDRVGGIKNVDKIMTQRDELLADLQAIIAAVEYTPLGVGAIKAIKQAKSAIAKAKEAS